MIKFKTAFVSFFPVIPDNTGSSTVVNSRFKNWPNKKKLFQISHIKKINNRSFKTIFVKKETPINKIINLPKLIFEIIKFLKKTKNKLIVIEGASWIFYSFIVLFSLKFLLPNSKIVYISHSVESEIRKKYSNILIFNLTKFLEKLVFKYSHISTTVSKIEQNKIMKLYNQKTISYPNALTLNNKILKKILIKDYIIYTGSYLYRPNKNAIDILNKKIMPMLLAKFPNLQLVLTGGGFKKKIPWVINKGIVKKKDLYNLIYYSKCMCVPLKFGSGTRMKIIEAMALGAIVVSTTKGIEGIDLKNQNPPFIKNNIKEIVNTIITIITKNESIKKKSLVQRNYYYERYSMKKNTQNFIKQNIRF